MKYISDETENNLIKNLLNKVDIKLEKTVKLNEGTTSSKVFLANDKYILKFGKKIDIEAEKLFYNTNKNKLFPEIYYADNNCIIMNYIKGNKISEQVDSKKLILKLFDVVKSYKKDNKNSKFGYFDNQFKTLEEAFIYEVTESKKINNILNEEDYNIVLQAIKKLAQYKIDKVICNGDFGTHNFIFNNNEIVGIIDPQSFMGDRDYDIIFAYLSNTKILQDLSYNNFFEIIGEKDKNINLLTILLYNRIAICIKHHPKDLEKYLAKWDELKTIN